jgi:two-component system LytT family response regulator
MTTAPISTLIVDDEPLGRDLLRLMLAAHSDFQVIAECADGEKALAAIKRHAPQLVFLDVKMPRLDGLGLLQKLPGERRPLIVFVTAHEGYALPAFETQALDYLLKPFDQERFDRMLGRVRSRLEQLKAAELGQSVLQLLDTPAKPESRTGSGAFVERLVVRDRGHVYFVGTAEISWLEASGNYVALHLKSGKTHLLLETMTALENKLDPGVFLRIHRSTIVNIVRIKQLEPHFNGEYVVVLDDNVRLKLSRSYLEPARRALGLV